MVLYRSCGKGYSRNATVMAVNRRAKMALKKPTRAEVKQIVKKAVRKVGESKRVDGSISSWWRPDNQPVVFTDDMIQGNGDNQREGDQINPTTFRIKNYITWTSTATSAVPLRHIAIQLKQNNGNTLALSDVLADTDATELIQSPYYEDKRNLYKVLWDKTINPPQGSIGNFNYNKLVNFGTTKMNKVQYIGATTNTVSGQIQAWWISPLAAGAANSPLYNSISSIRYRDA